MNFYVFIKMKQGGSLMHVYTLEHIALHTEPIDGCGPNSVGMKLSWPCT